MVSLRSRCECIDVVLCCVRRKNNAEYWFCVAPNVIPFSPFTSAATGEWCGLQHCAEHNSREGFTHHFRRYRWILCPAYVYANVLFHIVTFPEGESLVNFITCMTSRVDTGRNNLIECGHTRKAHPWLRQVHVYIHVAMITQNLLTTAAVNCKVDWCSRSSVSLMSFKFLMCFKLVFCWLSCQH